MTHTSREYAEALFELALEAEETAAFSAGLDLVEEGLKENPGFLALLSSPAISREERMDALSAAFQERIPLLRGAVFGKIDQQFAERDNIKFLFHMFPSDYFSQADTVILPAPDRSVK